MADNREVLVQHQIKNAEQAREMGKKGGSVSSDKKKYAAQLRCLKQRVKKGQITTKDEEWLLARVTDPNASAINIVGLLDDVEKVGLDKETKIKLANAYSNAHKLIHGQKIILIDDIFTTGSTLNECAKVLKQAGAREVWGLVIARD